MSGWSVSRSQPNAAVWGGAAIGAANAIPAVTGPLSGWAVYRWQPSTAVWGGIAAFSNVLPAGTGVQVTGDYDGKTWWKKRWILRL